MKKWSDPSLLLAATLGGSLFIFLILRALRFPMTVDESHSYYALATQFSAKDLLFYSRDTNTNNHVLNTLGIKFFTWLFGTTSLTVRLTALLGAAAYIGAAIGIAFELSKNFWVRAFALVLFFGNPYFVEFLAFARGYGLSAGLMLAAIYLWLRFLKSQEIRLRLLFAALFAAFLSIEANFTYLYFFLPFLALCKWSLWQKTGSIPELLRHSWPLWAATLLVALFVLPPMIRISDHDELRYWPTSSFWKDTLVPFIESSLKLHVKGEFEAVVLGAAKGATALAGLSLLVLLVSVFWKKVQRTEPIFWAMWLLPGVLLANFVFVWVLKSPYLGQRPATIFWPLFALSVAGMAAIIFEKWSRLAFAGIALVVGGYLGNNFFKCSTLTECWEWWFDANTLRTLNVIRDTYQKEGRTQPFTLEVNGFFHNSYRFHVRYDQNGYGKFAQIEEWHGFDTPRAGTDFVVTWSEQQRKDLAEKYHVVYDLDSGPDWKLMRRMEH